MIPLFLTLALAQGPQLTLDEALRKAKANPRAEAALAAVRQQEHKVTEARAGYLPSASAQFGYSRATANNATQPGLRFGGTTPEASMDNFGFYSASLNASQTLWDFGRTKASVDAANANVEVSKRDAEGTVQDLELGVRTAYFSVLSAEALAKAAAENIAAQEKHVQQAQVGADVGRRPAYDVTRAKLDLGNARVAQVQADNAVKLARADLSHAVGEDVSQAPLAPAGEGKDADPTLEQAVSAALAHRPELAEQDARIAAQKSVVELARRQYYPSLGLTGQFNYRGAEFPLVPNWQLGAGLSVPILNGGADEARIADQSAALEALQRTRDALVLDVRQAVEQQLIAVQEAKERAALAAEVIGSARETVRLAEGRYEAGAGTIVELADAQSSLANALAQEIKAKLDLAVARARLLRATGGT